MPECLFIGNYTSNLIGKTITYGSKLRKDFEKYGIENLFFVKIEESGFRSIRASPKMYPEEKGIAVKASKGRFMMPYRDKKDFMEYASLERNKVMIVGLGPCFEIWNMEKLDEFLETTDF